MSPHCVHQAGSILLMRCHFLLLYIRFYRCSVFVPFFRCGPQPEALILYLYLHKLNKFPMYFPCFSRITNTFFLRLGSWEILVKLSNVFFVYLIFVTYFWVKAIMGIVNFGTREYWLKSWYMIMSEACNGEIKGLEVSDRRWNMIWWQRWHQRGRRRVFG